MKGMSGMGKLNPRQMKMKDRDGGKELMQRRAEDDGGKDVMQRQIFGDG